MQWCQILVKLKAQLLLNFSFNRFLCPIKYVLSFLQGSWRPAPTEQLRRKWRRRESESGASTPQPGLCGLRKQPSQPVSRAGTSLRAHATRSFASHDIAYYVSTHDVAGLVRAPPAGPDGDGGSKPEGEEATENRPQQSSARK